MQLVALGTNGFFPTEGRQTMSFLVLAEGVALLLDAGTGVGRLLAPDLRRLLEPYGRLEVLLTHYHLDHVVGLTFLHAVLPGMALAVHAPAPPLVDGTPAEALERLISPPLFPVPMAAIKPPLEIVPYSASALILGTLRLRLRRQDHSGGSVGVRVGDRLAYLTDTAVEPASVEFAAGVDVLLHEVWLRHEEAAGQRPSGHSTTRQVAALARDAGVGRLHPVHHHPRRSSEEIEAMAGEIRELSGVPVQVLEEGVVYSVP